jgi:hypothetical protein
MQREKQQMSMGPEFSELPDASSAPNVPIPARASRQPMSSVWVDPVVQRTMLEAYLPDEEQRMQQAHISGHQVQVRQLSPAPSPIPPRASARISAARSGLSKIRPHTAPLPDIAHSDVTRMPTVPHSDVTRMPTVPQGPQVKKWQHETSSFAASSSLPALPLFHQDAVATPVQGAHAPTGARVTTGGLIDEIKTQPPMPQGNSGKLPSVTGVYEVPWTAGVGANSRFARYLASAKKVRTTYMLNPTERIRWWLLYPGRIEFLLWFGGTLLLLTITCLFLFVSLLSMGWIDNHGAATTAGANAAGARAAQAVSAGGPRVVVLTASPLHPGQSVRLAGQGFSHNAPIMLTHDNNQVCEPAWIATDGNGAFTVTVLLGSGNAAWSVGSHAIRAYDTLGKHTVAITVILVKGAAGQAAPPSSAPVAPGPAVTATAATNNGTGVVPSATPTASITPAVTPTSPVATPTPPKATPTAAISPTPTVKPSPTVGAKPTVGVTPTPRSHVILPQSLSLQDGTPTPGVPSNVLLMLIIIGYCTALLLLGLAGLLHHRSHAHRSNR